MRNLLILLLLFAFACTPVRRGGGGDDDDSASDDDDHTDDDDDDDSFSVEGEVSLSGEPIGSVTLPAVLGVIRDPQTERMSAGIFAGAGVGCDSFVDYAETYLQMGRLFDEGEIDAETYIDALSAALVEFIGPSSWVFLADIDSSVSDAEVPLDVPEGDWDTPQIVTIGRLASSPDAADLLAEGGSNSLGDGGWSGTIDSFSNTAGLVGEFTASLDWGPDTGSVSIDGDASVGICLVQGTP